MPQDEVARSTAPTSHARGDGRERILTAATELMLDDRMSSVSHRSVAARADVALGLIRYHFSTRSELLLACVMRLLEQRSAAAQEAIAACGPDLDTRECARLAVLAYAGPNVSDRALASSLGWLIDSAREDESLSSYIIGQRAFVEADLAEVLRRCGQPEGLTDLVANAIDGSFVTAVVDKKPHLHEQAVTACQRVLSLARGHR